MWGCERQACAKRSKSERKRGVFSTRRGLVRAQMERRQPEGFIHQQSAPGAPRGGANPWVGGAALGVLRGPGDQKCQVELPPNPPTPHPQRLQSRRGVGGEILGWHSREESGVGRAGRGLGLAEEGGVWGWQSREGSAGTIQAESWWLERKNGMIEGSPQ